ncbi:MAG: phosphate acyltransferase PlsX [Verrucomicrobiales bacterium]
MNIALDAMGGDNGVGPNLGGARLALEAFPQISKLFLVGREAELAKGLQKLGFSSPRCEIVHAAEVVEMKESISAAVRRKKDSSINVATELMKKGGVQAVVSAGHTGAAVAASTLKLRTIPGMDRAGILSPFPSEFGVCYVIDVGANVDSRPEHLVQHALAGWTYITRVHGKNNPAVGLMSNGEEDSKGNEVTKEVFARLQELKAQGLNFIGNIEGRDIMTTPVDLAVCDGFVGNVLLKGCEGTARAMSRLIKSELMKSPVRKFGAWLVRGAFKAAADRLSYESYGGSPLLGVNGVTIISHGSSNAIAIKNAIRVAAEVIAHEVNPHIEETLARFLGTNVTAPGVMSAH